MRRLRANYVRVRPELSAGGLEALVQAGMRSYLRYWCEAFRLPELSVVELAASVRPVGAEALRTELAQGRSVAAFLAHMGNWDLAGAWSSSSLAPVVTVAERLRPEALFEEFVSFRTGLGMSILPLTGGAPSFPELVRAVEGGGRLVPLLADRDLTSHGVEVVFCGRRARMAAGPAALAVSTGCSLYPISMRHESVPRRVAPGGWRTVITFHDRVVDDGGGSSEERVARLTQRCAEVMSVQVRRYTQDWHMMQQVFVGDGFGPEGLRRGEGRP